mgnify:CR=1|jgi:hypothetical protein|tara:strand:+ start:734 stop:865 length:132 start_codon:yes stop_codon:yes gene_type:complete
MKYTPNKYTGRSLMHEGGTHKKKKAKAKYKKGGKVVMHVCKPN